MRYYKTILKKILFFFVSILLLTSCKTTTKIVEVPVETIKTEYIEQVKYDSI